MKILLACPRSNPAVINTNEQSITIPPDGVLALNLTGKARSGVVVRHDGELVTRSGWVCLDYDDEGYLVGLEFHEGDPFEANTKNMSYLQPNNPVANTPNQGVQ